MTDKPPAVLERLWEDVPVHQIPVEEIVGGARAVRRRRRAGLAGAGAATCVALTIAATTVPGLLNDETGDRLVGDQATPGPR
jgi:hypothetical protein